MKIKINYILGILIMILLLIVLFIDENTLSSLYFSYDDTFVINEINIGRREDSIVYNNEISTNVSDVSVSMINNNVDRWIWPTIGSYVLTNYFSGYHNAVDIASDNGSDIYAANSGVVVTVQGGCVVGNLSCNGKGGNYIIIKHNSNNYYTVYMHLRDIKVSVGQVVGSGQVIGTMGNTGNVYPVPYNSGSVSGTHLHFCLYIGEPYRGGYAINPLSVY